MARVGEKIVVFDGVCNFCSWSMRFILHTDVRGIIQFAPLQSAIGQSLLDQNGLDPNDPQTFLFLDDGKVYVMSDAALQIVQYLGPWRLLRVLRFLPRGLRDWLYMILARNRYRWFGKRQVCFIPTEEQRARFIDLPKS